MKESTLIRITIYGGIVWFAGAIAMAALADATENDLYGWISVVLLVLGLVAAIEIGLRKTRD